MLVGKAHHDASCPECIFFGHTKESSIGVLGSPFFRLEKVSLEIPDARVIRILHLDPGTYPQPQRKNGLERRTRLPHVLVSSPGLLREIRRASQRGTKIKQVVANKLASVLGDQSVEGIDAARVIMIQPGAENPQSAQLTSMFMRNDVVRIIRANTVVSILPEKSPWNKLAGHGSILAI